MFTSSQADQVITARTQQKYMREATELWRRLLKNIAFVPWFINYVDEVSIISKQTKIYFLLKELNKV